MIHPEIFLYFRNEGLTGCRAMSWFNTCGGLKGRFIILLTKKLNNDIKPVPTIPEIKTIKSNIRCSDKLINNEKFRLKNFPKNADLK